jgi:aminoglycoside phosphotransferase (APT) family kinase protein
VSAAPIFEGPVIEAAPLDRSWGVLALIHLAIVEDEADPLPLLWRTFRACRGPAWDALELLHPDGWRAMDALAELVALLHRRAELAPLAGAWTTRRAALARWVAGEADAKISDLRVRLRERGAWRLPCGHSIHELDAPGVCEGCTVENLRRRGAA